MTTSAAADRDATWRERGGTFAVFLSLGLGVGAWAAAIPGLKAKLDLSDSGLSLALLAVSIGAVLSTVATGIVAPRFGTGRSSGFAAFALVVAIALPAAAATLTQLIVCAFLIGLACGALDIAVNSHASEIERRWRSPIMSSFHAAFSIGGLLGSTFGGFIASLGWGVGGQLLAPLVPGILLLAVSTPMLGVGNRSSEKHGTGLAWPERSALGLCATVALCFLIEGTMADWSAVYLRTVAQASAAVSAGGYAAFSLAMAGARLVGDGIVRKLGAKRVVLFGAAAAAIGMGIAVAFPQPWLAAAGFALVGLGLANVVPVVFSAASRFGASPSAGVAMVATCGYAGFLGGPPLIGAVAAWSSLRVGLGLMVLAAVLVGFGGFGVARRGRAD